METLRDVKRDVTVVGLFDPKALIAHAKPDEIDDACSSSTIRAVAGAYHHCFAGI